MLNVAASDESGEPTQLELHGRHAVAEYQKIRPLYEAFAGIIQSILREALSEANIKVSSIEPRAKSLESLERKAATPSTEDPEKPKYLDPLSQITDLAGARVITFFPKTVKEVDSILNDQFDIREKSDKSTTLEQEDRFGYQSIHYLVSLGQDRLSLPEYIRYKGLIAEIQVRTVLQHAWAEIEHDIQYKSLEVAPVAIRRRFMALAGLLEIADREFQAIQDDDVTLSQKARLSVRRGELERVEITPDALKEYLDRRLGPDRRIASSWYQTMAEDLRRMGFTNFQQIDECFRIHDPDQLNKIVWGIRQGQNWRFLTSLMAAMGENWIKLHPRGRENDMAQIWKDVREKMQQAGVNMGDYAPS